jgi:hypothetical protein
MGLGSGLAADFLESVSNLAFYAGYVFLYTLVKDLGVGGTSATSRFREREV